VPAWLKESKMDPNPPPFKARYWLLAVLWSLRWAEAFWYYFFQIPLVWLILSSAFYTARFLLRYCFPWKLAWHIVGTLIDFFSLYPTSSPTGYWKRLVSGASEAPPLTNPPTDGLTSAPTPVPVVARTAPTKPMESAGTLMEDPTEDPTDFMDDHSWEPADAVGSTSTSEAGRGEYDGNSASKSTSAKKSARPRPRPRTSPRKVSSPAQQRQSLLRRRQSPELFSEWSRFDEDTQLALKLSEATVRFQRTPRVEIQIHI